MEVQIYNAEYTIHVSDADIKLYQMAYFPKKEYTVHLTNRENHELCRTETEDQPRPER